ncbi:MAG: hypothetical protein AAGC63_06610 [Propionicimonas sp.]|nr:hypothetical protein [Propionicimonas sp.]
MTDPVRRSRLLFGAGAVIATVVAVVFATVGDGVIVPEATGVRGFVIDYAHTAVWVLLAVALGTAASRGRWTPWAGRLAVAALVLYLGFLAAVFLVS